MVTVLTRTIGPSGRDYASFTLAEADVTNIGTSADLVANDEAIVFEADAGTYNEGLGISSSLTTDPTRNVTYKAAAGSEHGGQQAAGVTIAAPSGHTSTTIDDFVVIDGLNLSTPSGGAYCIRMLSDGVIARNCVLTSPWAGVFISNAGTVSHPSTVENCVCHVGAHAVVATESRAGQSTFGSTLYQ